MNMVIIVLNNYVVKKSYKKQHVLNGGTDFLVELLRFLIRTCYGNYRAMFEIDSNMSNLTKRANR